MSSWWSFFPFALRLVCWYVVVVVLCQRMCAGFSVYCEFRVFREQLWLL